MSGRKQQPVGQPSARPAGKSPGKIGVRPPPSRQRRLGRAAGVVAVLTVVAGLTTLGLNRSSTASPGAGNQVTYVAATKALAFRLPAFAGGTVGNADSAGRPMVVNFYASWCEVCNAEMPSFEKVHQQLGNRVTFLGVNPQQGGSDTDGAQAAMVARTGVTYATARDAQNTLLVMFNTSGALPTTLFVDATGHVVDVHNGGLTEASLTSLIAHDLGVGG